MKWATIGLIVGLLSVGAIGATDTTTESASFSTYNPARDDLSQLEGAIVTASGGGMSGIDGWDSDGFWGAPSITEDGMTGTVRRRRPWAGGLTKPLELSITFPATAQRVEVRFFGGGELGSNIYVFAYDPASGWSYVETKHVGN